MISSYEKQYMDILMDIYENGYEDGINERTGVATKRLPGQVIRIDVEKEFPILKSKRVFWKSAMQEICWIWKKQSNNINDLKPHIWDEWADKNGSIGKAYGYQMRRPIVINIDTKNHSQEGLRFYPDQAHYIVEYLREFPNGRWGIATIWNPSELKDMNLCPCCHTTTWNLDGGRLNCLLDQRSGDFPYGVPFNTTQYAILMCHMAKTLNVKPGILTHVIADAHIYDRQMEGVKQQIDLYRLIRGVSDHDGFNAEDIIFAETLFERYKKQPIAYPDFKTVTIKDFMEEILAAVNSVPVFYIEPGVTDFFKMDETNSYVDNYRSLHAIDFGDIVV